jgi:hypothetical protein
VEGISDGDLVLLLGAQGMDRAAEIACGLLEPNGEIRPMSP